MKMFFIYSRYFVFTIFFGLSFIVSAQFPNPLDFNTATNSTNTGTIPVGATDLHWTAALTNSLGPYVPAVSCGNIAPGNWATSPFTNANWITYPHGCSANPAEHSCLGSIDEYYKLTFTLPTANCSQAINTASAYCLSLDFFADNWVTAIYVNGISSVSNPTSNPYNSWGFLSSAKVTAVMCNNWQPGLNTVIVKVQSGAPTFPGYSGFLAQANQTINTTVGQPYMNASITQTNVSCNGGSNGTASVSVTGGAPPYSYTWFPSGGSGNTAAGLTPGNYTVIASSGSCSVTKTLTITQPAPFSITASPNVTLCSGNSATLSASGAATYSWNTGSSNSSILVNSPGVFTVTGFNSSGCQDSKTISVSAGPAPILSVSGPTSTCAGTAVTFNASGAYSYTWSTGAQTNSITVSPASSAVYTVSGSSPGLVCPASQTIGLTVNNFLTLTVGGPSSICAGSSAVLSVTGANSYTWSTGAVSNSISVSPVATAIYSVAGSNTITGCTGTATAQLVVNPLPQLSVYNASVCTGSSTVINASGASSYTWSNGYLSPTTTVSSPGTYSVLGASSQGCISMETITVTNYSLPVITIAGNNTLCAGQNGSLIANGASSYTWSTGSNNQILNLPSLTSSNVYTVTGLDINTGCSNSSSFTLTVFALPTVAITGNSVSCDGTQVNLSASGASTYTWNNGATSSFITVNPFSTSVYSVTGVDSHGCLSSANHTVFTSVSPTVVAASATVCAGAPLLLTASGALSYAWSTGETTSSITIATFSQTTYTVTGFGVFSDCKSIKVVTVSVVPAPQLSSNYNNIGICRGESLTLTVSGGQNYFWSTGAATSSILVSPTASVIYTVTSNQGSNICVSSKTVQVNVYDLPPVKIIGDTLLCDGERTILYAGGADSYQWSTGSSKDQIEVLINQNALYLLYGTDVETGCKNMDSIRLGNSEKCCDVYIPNSFTPNEDNKNEDFGPVSLCEFLDYKMYVFDKWGELIFTSNNLATRWNGYYKGVLCKEDVYVYLIRAKRKGIGFKTYEKTGHVSLIK